MPIKILPTGAALGAEISGIDLAKEIDDATFAQVRQAFYQHEVIFFRDRELNDDDHVRLSARFGELRKLKPFLGKGNALRPEISIISNIIEDGKYIGSYDAGTFWHTDGPYLANPHAASLLRAIEVPQKNGHTLGATLYASMTAAYDDLAPDMKKRIEGLEAVHSVVHRDEKAKHNSGQERPGRPKEQQSTPEAVHPVVWRHPVTQRKCLYVNEGFTARIVGMPEDESKDLLAELTSHSTQPRFVYAHHWRPHDLIMWDNCSTQHKATFDYALPQRRLMHRTVVIKGT